MAGTAYVKYFKDNGNEFSTEEYSRAGARMSSFVHSWIDTKLLLLIYVYILSLYYAKIDKHFQNVKRFGAIFSPFVVN